MYSTRRQRSLPLCFKFCGVAISLDGLFLYPIVTVAILIHSFFTLMLSRLI